MTAITVHDHAGSGSGVGFSAARAERVRSRLARWTAIPRSMASSAWGLLAWTPETTYCSMVVSIAMLLGRTGILAAKARVATARGGTGRCGAARRPPRTCWTRRLERAEHPRLAASVKPYLTITI